MVRLRFWSQTLPEMAIHGHSMVGRQFGSSPINAGVFNSSVPQHMQHVESSWAHRPWVGMSFGCRDACQPKDHGKRRWRSVCTPESARQTQNLEQLSLLSLRKGWKGQSAIGATQWNFIELHRLCHRWAAVCAWMSGPGAMDHQKWQTISRLV